MASLERRAHNVKESNLRAVYRRRLSHWSSRVATTACRQLCRKSGHTINSTKFEKAGEAETLAQEIHNDRKCTSGSDHHLLKAQCWIREMASGSVLEGSKGADSGESS